MGPGGVASLLLRLLLLSLLRSSVSICRSLVEFQLVFSILSVGNLIIRIFSFLLEKISFSMKEDREIKEIKDCRIFKESCVIK